VATTRSRPPRGREQARHASGGTAVEHTGKIYAVAIGGVIAVLAFLILTSMGHVVAAAVQHFMLYYAGVFTLIALCASVGLGLVATDRMVLSPGHRVLAQSTHRVVSFGALAFLVIHIVTEILAQRVHVIDAFIPFLSPFRTFYIGLGTIASDLILLIVITSIFRKRFTSKANAWKWRAIHYTAYLSFVFGVWHGLLAGRPGKPYVDWSYGFVVAFVALGLGVRILSNSLRPKETLSSAPVPESGMGSGSAPMRAAAMFTQLKVVRDRLTAGELTAGGFGGRTTGPLLVTAGQFEALPPAGRSTGAMPVTAALTAPVMEQPITSLAPGSRTGEQPVYEPGYVGPARYQGAPRNPSSGPMPRLAAGPLGEPTGPLPRAQQGTGPLPRAATGPMPRAATGPMPRAATGPMPRAATGPMPRFDPLPPTRQQRPATGPMQRLDSMPPPSQQRPASGPMPRLESPPPADPQRPATGPMPRAATGPMPRAASGPMPRPATGPMPRSDAGPRPRPATGPMPRAGSGPRPRPATGPMPRQATSPGPYHDSGPRPRPDTGQMPRGGTGAAPRPATGPMPRAAGSSGGGGAPQPPAGPSGRSATGPRPRPATGPRPRPASGPMPRAATGSFPAAASPPWEGGMPELDPRLRNREPGPGMPGYRPSAPRGVDPYATDPYGRHLHSTGEFSTAQYSGDQYGGDQYGGDGYRGEDGYGRDGYDPNFYGQDDYGWDGER